MSCYMDKMEYKKYPPKWDCGPKYDMDCDYDDDMDDDDCDSYPKKKYYPAGMHKTHCMPHQHMPMECCDMPMKCKTEKTCVKTFKCTYKLYKVCTYKLYKVCPKCGHEYDYYRMPYCPKCR